MNEVNNRILGVLLTLMQDTELSQFWTPQDKRYIQARIEAEGLVFLTDVLPRLAKALQRSFQTGELERIEGFTCAKNEAYPSFLKKAWATLYTTHDLPISKAEDAKKKVALLREELRDSTSGLFLLNDAQRFTYVGAVRIIRQVSLMCYKTKLPYSKDQVKKVTDAFIQAEVDLRDLNLSREATSF